ncbi:DUF3575 domain-containing protein [Poritiphilus flavus]|uniref:DUF3575 domain-containing protein n=1 Tax=Poritiphilus flavus TaxID=2697053 RepID=A0A6L9EI96_9FLAO|nr:DUF3575 domain-containing protein [Poritiphilus flavus]NAS13909.1 DUF3575 domain-containing protein [Poritiphilus flavus]
MRKFVCIALISNFCLLSAQQPMEPYGGANEIKFNLAYGLLGVPEFGYERIISDESAMGIDAILAFDSKADYRYGITPYYRFYFGEKRAGGFFVEAHTAIYALREYEQNTLSGEETSSNQLVVGLGTAVGGKFLNKQGWVGEIYGGFGRNLNSGDDIDWGYPRFGFVIGKRF